MKTKVLSSIGLIFVAYLCWQAYVMFTMKGNYEDLTSLLKSTRSYTSVKMNKRDIDYLKKAKNSWKNLQKVKPLMSLEKTLKRFQI